MSATLRKDVRLHGLAGQWFVFLAEPTGFLTANPVGLVEDRWRDGARTWVALRWIRMGVYEPISEGHATRAAAVAAVIA